LLSRAALTAKSRLLCDVSTQTTLLAPLTAAWIPKPPVWLRSLLH